MADLFISYDPAQPAGQRLAPEVREEINEVAPSTLNDGSVITAKLADKAVATAKLGDAAVTSTKIASGAVAAANLGTGAVTTTKLEDDAVTAAKAGTGVVTAYDNNGNPIESKHVYMTVAQYAAITADPNTTYFLSA